MMMLSDDDFTKGVQQVDQIAEAVKLLAVPSGAFYRKLVDEGIPPDGAAIIVAAWLREFVRNVKTGDRPPSP